MITDLLKPAWKSKSADTRLKALRELDTNDTDAQAIVLALCDDPEEPVCVAAVDRLECVATLLTMHRDHASEHVRQTALARFTRLVGIADRVDEVLALELVAEHPACAPLLAAHAASEQVRTRMVRDLAHAHRMVVLSETGFADTRRSIVLLLESLDHMQEAREALRDRDADMESLLDERIGALQQKQRAQAAHEATVDALLAEAEHLAGRAWQADSKARAQANIARWDSLVLPVDEARQKRYLAARTVMASQVEKQRRVESLDAAQAQLTSELDTLWQDILQAGLDTLLENIGDYAPKLQGIRRRWDELDFTAQAAPVTYPDLAQALETAISLFSRASGVDGDAGRAKALVDAIEQAAWPEGIEVPKSVNRLRKQLEGQQEAAATAATQAPDLLKKINSVSSLARAGNLRRARQVLAKVEKSLEGLPQRERQRLETRVAEAAETLGKMDDWKSFATEPKYTELCEAMEALVGSDLHPDNQAGKIKALQKQWKALGDSAVSQKYWPRFKQAADKAYEPCAAFFATRHEQRTANLQRRQEYVDRLQELLDETNRAENPDYKTLQGQLRSTVDGFLAVKDVERSEGNKQFKAFSKLRHAVQGKLDKVYDANIAEKRHLIEQLESLASADVTDSTLDRLKQIQGRWKQVGITRRKDDQKAWKAFKRVGDQVFEKVQAERKAARAQTDRELDAYRDVIKALQSLSRTADDLPGIDRQFAELQKTWDSLPPLPDNLPPKLTKGVKQDYRNACSQLDKRRRDIIDGQRRGEVEALRSKAELCLRLEGLGGNAGEEDLQAIDQAWQDIDLHDHDMTRRIEARRAAAAEPADRDAIAAERRLFCIRVEIASGQDSPAEDRSLRTQYQLERMNTAGLGQANIDIDLDPESLEVEWLCMPGAQAEEQAKLDKRFYRVLKGLRR